MARDKMIAVLVGILLAFTVLRGWADDSDTADQEPVSIRHIESAWVFGPPMRKYERLMLGGDLRQEQMREFRSFFPELATLDSAKGIDPIDLPKKHRVRLFLKSKLNDSFHLDFYVLGDSVWTYGGKYFRLRKGWPEFVSKHFAAQEEFAERHGKLKVEGVDKDNAHLHGFHVEIGAIREYKHKQFVVLMNPRRAEKFEHATVTYARNGETQLTAAAGSRTTDDGKLRLSFNFNPKIATDIHFNVLMAENPRPTIFKFEIPTFVDEIRSSWIEAARAHVRADKAIQEKIADQPYVPKQTRVTGNGFGAWVVTLNYGSLAYDTLWAVTVEMDSKGNVVKTDVKLYGFE